MQQGTPLTSWLDKVIVLGSRLPPSEAEGGTLLSRGQASMPTIFELASEGLGGPFFRILETGQEVTVCECWRRRPSKPFYCPMHRCCLDIAKTVIQARSASYPTDDFNLTVTSMPRLWDVLEARYNEAKKGTLQPFCWLPEPRGYYGTGKYSNMEWEVFQEGENEYQVR